MRKEVLPRGRHVLESGELGGFLTRSREMGPRLVTFWPDVCLLEQINF